MNRKFYALSSLLFLLACSSLQAQIVGTDCFLQGLYTEVGINNCGVFGSNNNPGALIGPVGTVYHPNVTSGLGFVADSDEDGWDIVFPPYCGDYFVPGSPVEGFALQIGGTTLINENSTCTFGDIPGSITSYTDLGTERQSVWEGTANFGLTTVDITQTTIVPTDKLYFIAFVEMCNTGGATIPTMYYARNVDPDNDQPWTGGSFTTTNEVISQPPGECDALVTAVGPLGCFLGLGARDSSARVSYGAFFMGIPEQIWSGTGPHSSSGINTADEAISLAFRLDNIAPGECRTIAFAYVLDASDLAEALDATAAFSVLADSVDITAIGSVEICQGDSVTLELTGADDYEWTWSPSGTLDTDTGSIVVASPLTTTVYTAVGTGGICDTLEREITVIVDTLPPFAEAGPDQFICPGESATLEGEGGIMWSWTPTTGLSDPSAQMPVATPSVTTTYFLTTMTALGCTATDSVTVTVYDLPNVTVSDDTEICIGDATDLLAEGAVDYSWSPSTGLDPDNTAATTADPTSTTTYTVTGTDANGCSNTASVTVIVNPLPTVDAIATPSTIDIVLDEFAILSGSGGILYSWSPPEGLVGSTDLQDVTAQPQDTTTYYVTVTDANGCVNIDSVTLNIIGEYQVFLPTAFSPNGDGVNDLYYPWIIGTSSNRALDSWSIYNRWGEEVFRATTDRPGWDGRIGGELQPVGTYVVILRSTNAGQQEILRETFQLVR